MKKTRTYCPGVLFLGITLSLVLLFLLVRYQP